MQPKFTKPATCQPCSLYTSGFGYAPVAGPPSARVVFVAEALGGDEAIRGEALVGAAGGVHSRVLVRAGVTREFTRAVNCVNCFPGDTLIQAPDLRRGFRRRYVGQMVTATTHQGVLTGTPNHPVLTATGWKGLGELQNGDYLVRPHVRDDVPARRSYPDVQYMPTPIAQVFKACADRWTSARMVGRHMDFHGDGTNAEIEVVPSGGRLIQSVDVPILEQLLEDIFEPSDMTAALLKAISTRPTTAIDGSAIYWLSSDGIMCSTGEAFTSLTPLSSHSEPARLGFGSTWDGELFEGLPDLSVAEMQAALDLLRRLSAQVEFCEVTGIALSQFDGHVYNLETGPHKYIANGFIVHNCQPPGNFLEGAPWEHDALQHCRQYLDPVLAQIPRDGVVVTLGGTALKHVLNLHHLEGITVKDWHHTVNRSPDDRYWVVPTFHPSHLQRGAMSLLEVVTGAYKLADEIAAKGFVRSPARLVVDPEPAWYEKWVDDHLARVAHDPDGVHFVIDTEFKEKIGGQDESEIDLKGSFASPLLRINGANSREEGWTVPYTETFIRITEKLLAGLAQLRGIMWAWNKYADWDHLAAAGHTLDGIECYDAMWAWHYLQSDLPRGLGFVSPLASDFGPWKHWAKMDAQEGPYAAADGLQTWRVGPGWILPALVRSGMWEIFVRDWHERDYFVLRPSLALGVPADRAKLEAFHVQLQQSQIRLLKQIKDVGAQGTLKPAAGYKKRPGFNKADTYQSMGIDVKACTAAKHDLYWQDGAIHGGAGVQFGCRTCRIGGGFSGDPAPPKSMLGTKKGKRTSEAKAQYNADEIRLVERTVHSVALVCVACGAVDVRPTHRCKAVSSKPTAKKTRRRGDAGIVPAVQTQDDRDQPAVLEGSESDGRPAPPARHLVSQQIEQTRWFWQLPFNPDSWQQLLAYIGAAGHTPGTSKKTRRPTTDAASLKKLAAETGDVLYQSILDYRAVVKVDSTYAIGTLDRLDSDNRVHPEIMPKPSTLRDSSSGPNLQNVVADKSGPAGLASGFRTCIVARDGLPPGVSEQEYQQWATRWGITT